MESKKKEKTASSRTCPPRTELLRVENLSRHFKMGRKVLKAVDGVSFEIGKGEAFGLVGESGSGKTTTGRAIVGLYEPSVGKIYFHGKLIASADKQEKKLVAKNRNEARGIQMIFQDPVASLNPRMTVREIIAEGIVVNGEKDKEKISEKVYGALKEVGLLPEHASRYPHEFSGGQRQRIGIARSLVMEPELIIADEPVSALDVSIQAQVINLLTDLKERLGLTVLFIAHDLSVVRYFCDRIAVMRFGKLVELASANELFSHPLHPYTKSLLSAIPYPDPDYEKRRTRLVYQPKENADGEIPAFREVTKGHFVYCTAEEFDAYKKERKEKKRK